MFTGIIEATAEVRDIEKSSITIDRPVSFDDIRIGSSICVSGTCLSVTSFDQKQITFDLAETTIAKTTIGKLKKGDRVNLERALKADGRFEGHIVLGHTEGIATVEEKKGERLTLQIPSALLPFIVLHGSISIDGVSLTVADLQKNLVTVAVIPLTAKETTLGTLKPSDHVNIETDILGKYLLNHAK